MRFQPDTQHYSYQTMKTDRYTKASRLIKAATLASVVCALVILTIKLFAWLKTDSVAVFSSLIDAALDLIVSSINFIAARYALKPPDDDHKFGHGKAEDIAALSQTGVILASAILICYQAFQRFINPVQIQHEEIGMVIMLISTAIVTALIIFQSYVRKHTSSSIVYADSYHYLTDIPSNLLVIASLYLSVIPSYSWIDPLLGTLVAFYILSGAFKIGKRSFDNLMDKEFASHQRDKIKKIVLAHEEIKGLHDLKTRAAGMHSFIQLHIELDGNMKLSKAHEISDRVEHKLANAFPGAEIIIHSDPALKYGKK